MTRIPIWRRRHDHVTVMLDDIVQADRERVRRLRASEPVQPRRPAQSFTCIVAVADDLRNALSEEPPTAC